ncbi:inositol-1-monophosphatase-like [Ylistrum balloti]|uniref:inositol-1-monophosphatase-like n=1 Tax=Ylistrum balloti TaxID=509963 RepID=UPI002905B2E2|nr:inositol-1-monophosphatase-like [Ylistrum balloti]
MEFVSTLLLEASKIALACRKNISVYKKNTSLSSKNEVFTNADLEVEHFLCKEIENSSQHTFVLGEEGVVEKLQRYDAHHLLSKKVWIIDPIDGTNNFLNGLPLWGISIGYTENYEFKHGAIVLPDIREMHISTKKGTYYYVSDVPLSEIQNIDTSQLLLYSKDTAEGTDTAHTTQKQQSNKLTTHSLARKNPQLGSCVFSIREVLAGNATVYSGKAKIWDYAACIALFRNAGYPVYFYAKNSQQLQTLPWKITSDNWSKNYTHSIYDLVFCKEYAKGCTLFSTKS